MKLLLFSLITAASLVLLGCAGARFTTKGGWSGPVIYQAEEKDDLIYVGSQEGRLLALNSSGDAKWSFPDASKDEDSLGAIIYGSPAVDAKRVYFGTYSGEMYALDAETGEKAVEWSVNPILVERASIIGAPTLAEKGQCVASGYRRAVRGDLLIFGTTDHNVYAVCAEDGSPVWSVETEGEVWGSPTVSGDTVYVGSQDGYMYAISLDLGIPRWPQGFKAGGAIVSQPFVADGRVFFGALDGKLYALDAESGNSVWREPFDGENWFWADVIGDGEKIYGVTIDGRVVALDPETGIQLWTVDLNEMVVSTPVLAQKQGEMRLIVAIKSGKIAVLRTDTGKEDGGRIPIADAEDQQVKIKASLGVAQSVIYINTLDPWSTQAVDLNAGGNTLWLCPPACKGLGE